MHLLVFGRTGQVGHELQRRAPAGVTITALDRTSVDITAAASVAQAIAAAGCDVVVNAAAHTAVDLAESEPESAFAVNADGPAFMAEACAAAGLPLIHLSTDYVFDGSKTGAYREDDPIAPLGVYGASKAAGERAVRERLAEHVIVRTAWVFGAHGKNFVKTMLRLGAERDALRIVADQTGCPTAAADIADAVLTVARQVAGRPADAPWGTYHFCGAECTTWHGFAASVFALRQELTGQASPRLDPIRTEEYPTPARRPMNSELDCSRIRQAFGIAAPDWHRSLADVMRELLEPQTRA